MTEQDIIDKILEKNSFMFRNDNGVGFREDGKRFRYGLLPGSADMIGWTEIEITLEMVGKKIAVFTSIEIKTKDDKISDKQKKWFRAVKNSGGIAEIYKESKNEEIIIQKNL